jgi:hypothetical protein
LNGIADGLKGFKVVCLGKSSMSLRKASFSELSSATALLVLEEFPESSLLLFLKDDCSTSGSSFGFSESFSPA